MTQRSGKFTRGSAVFEELRAARDGDGYVLTEGNRVEICHHGGATSLGLPREEILANADLIVAAFNAATTAENIGYDGQAAVEALPELLRVLHLYVYPGGFEGRPASTEQREQGIATLAACRKWSRPNERPTP